MNVLIRCIACAGLLAWCLPAQATDIRFVGAGNFQVSGSTVTVSFDRIENFDRTTRSGTLFLQLWASPDRDPVGSGYELTPAENLSTFVGAGNGTLSPGASFTDISFTTRYQPPPPGRYHVFLLVFEFPSLNAFLDSTPSIGNPHSLGGSAPPPGNPPPGNQPGTGLLELRLRDFRQ